MMKESPKTIVILLFFPPRPEILHVPPFPPLPPPPPSPPYANQEPLFVYLFGMQCNPPILPVFLVLVLCFLSFCSSFQCPHGLTAPLNRSREQPAESHATRGSRNPAFFIHRQERCVTFTGVPLLCSLFTQLVYFFLFRP